MALSPSAMTWKSRDTNHRRKCKNLLSLRQHFVWHPHFSDTAGKYSPAIPASPLAWKSNVVSQLGKLFLNTFFFLKEENNKHEVEGNYIFDEQHKQAGSAPPSSSMSSRLTIFRGCNFFPKELCLMAQALPFFPGRLLRHSPFQSRGSKGAFQDLPWVFLR